MLSCRIDVEACGGPGGRGQRCYASQIVIVLVNKHFKPRGGRIFDMCQKSDVIVQGMPLWRTHALYFVPLELFTALIFSL